MIKRCALAVSVLGVCGSPAQAQDLYQDLAIGAAKQGISQAEIILKQLPDMLDGGLEIAQSGHEFESAEFCRGNVQAIVNMGAVLSNMMPFTKVWTYEDERGPVGKLRIMLNGQQIHTEVYCDDTTLWSSELPWGEGDSTPEEVDLTTLSAMLGAGLNLQLQGLFDKEELSQARTTDSSDFDPNFLLPPKAASDPCGNTSVAGAAIGGPFELVSETGETVNDTDVITKPTLVYFGYTFCPDVCPLDTMRNAIAADILAELGVDIGTVFISVDPGRDTPQVVGDFTDNFHADMIGLTGSPTRCARRPRPTRPITAPSKATPLLSSRSFDPDLSDIPGDRFRHFLSARHARRTGG